MTITQLFPIATPVTFLLVASFGACGAANDGQAAEKAAVFEFELQHGSLVPGVPDRREAEEARLRMVGERLREIADELFISVKTVETHKQHIQEKLGLKNTAQLVKYAIEKNIG